MATCPCGSGRAFAQCCEPFILGASLPPTAEALMRSRYSAYTVKAIDYICDGRAPEERQNVNRPMIEKWANSAKWQGLDIHSVEGGNAADTAGVIDFSVRFAMDGRSQVYREISTFRQEDGRWYYVNGRMVAPGVPQPARTTVQAGRNDPCPCGSGRKYKKCCAAA